MYLGLNCLRAAAVRNECDERLAAAKHDLDKREAAATQELEKQAAKRLMSVLGRVEVLKRMCQGFMALHWQVSYHIDCLLSSI